jgi:hypothetical protein
MNEKFIFKDCPCCKGTGFVRGYVGGTYDCFECWKYSPEDEDIHTKNDADKEYVIENKNTEIAPKKRGRPKKIKDD